MKLLQIWNARPAWTTLSALRKPPGVAYRLLKYERLLDAELLTIEKMRNEAIFKAANIDSGAGSTVSLAPGTAEFQAFAEDFGAFLDTESELKPFDLDMDGLMAALDSQAGNTLAESDLSLLEPFFTPVEEVPTS